MNGFTFERFGMDTITLAGGLEVRLAAMKAAGFTQVMLSAANITGHEQGEAAAIDIVKRSGLRVTGLQVLRDFEGLSGHLHHYKLAVAQSMLRLAHALNAPMLLVCSSSSPRAEPDMASMARDLRKLATLAVPLNIKVGFEALSWGRHVNVMSQAWQVVEMAQCANLGIVIDSFHMLAAGSTAAEIELIDPSKIVLVQLSDFMWKVANFDERRETARHARVFPSEGVHNAQLADIMRALDNVGYAGEISFEVFNDDYVQMSAREVSARAMQSVQWLMQQVARTSLPVRRAVDVTPSRLRA